MHHEMPFPTHLPHLRNFTTHSNTHLPDTHYTTLYPTQYDTHFTKHLQCTHYGTHYGTHY